MQRTVFLYFTSTCSENKYTSISDSATCFHLSVVYPLLQKKKSQHENVRKKKSHQLSREKKFVSVSQSVVGYLISCFDRMFRICWIVAAFFCYKCTCTCLHCCGFDSYVLQLFLVFAIIWCRCILCLVNDLVITVINLIRIFNQTRMYWILTANWMRFSFFFLVVIWEYLLRNRVSYQPSTQNKHQLTINW